MTLTARLKVNGNENLLKTRNEPSYRHDYATTKKNIHTIPIFRNKA